MLVRFTIPGEPVGKGRPKFTTVGGYPRVYTPAKTTAYENKVKLCYVANCKNIKFGGPLSVVYKFYFPIPKSTSKKQTLLMLDGKINHTKKPDLDNVIKAVTDGLNGIAFDDDKQIVELHAVKLYSDKPRAEVEIESLPRLT